jgi:hypothetical protein
VHARKGVVILAILAATFAALLATPTVAAAGKTALCKADESPCSGGNVIIHVHESQVGKAKLLSEPTVECEVVLFLGDTVAGTSEPLEIKGKFTYEKCNNSCKVTEEEGPAVVSVLREESELATVTGEGLVKLNCFYGFINCRYTGEGLEGHGLGPLTSSSENGSVVIEEQETHKESGTCPEEAFLDLTTTPLSHTYIAKDEGPPTSLCSKDEGSPICKSENQLKSIDYKDKAVEILTNLINVKCEGLASGSVGEPGNPIEIKPELTYTNCSGGCFVTSVAGPGKVLLQREEKSEEAKATGEGFEIFVKCGTTIKCLLGPEKMTGTALGALTTGDNGHLTFSKVSMGKGEGATCPKEATLDALYVASSAAYIG